MIGKTNAQQLGGAAPTTNGKFMVTVLDYDGTILKQEFLNENDQFELPSAPDHTSDGLVFDGWSAPVDIVNNKVTVTDSDINIGVMCYTSSGKIETEIQVNANQTLTLNSQITGEKDWGDGTIDTELSHTYTTAGKYILKISNTSYNSIISPFFTPKADNGVILHIHFPQSVGDISFSDGGCVNLEYVTTHSRMNSNLRGYKYCYNLKFFITSTSVNYSNDPTTTLSSDTFYQCYNLKYIVFPNRKLKFMYGNNVNTAVELQNISFPNKNIDFVSSANSIFNSCQRIKKAKIPSNISFSTYGTNFLNNCRNLEEAIVDNSIIPGSCFGNCTNLKKVTLRNVTQIGSYAFSNCYLLTEIVFPSTLSTSNNIQSSTFENCRSCLIYDFSNCLGVIPLASTNAFTGINPLAKILVPSSLEASWKAASNWADLAAYIVGV